MKSFPSSLRKGGSSLSEVTANSSLKDQLFNSFTQGLTSTISNATSGKSLDTAGIEYEAMPDRREQLNKFDFTKEQVNITGNTFLYPDAYTSKIENMFRIGADVFNQMNNYRGYIKDAKVYIGFNNNPDNVDLEKAGANNTAVEGKNVVATFSKMSPSLFNPINGVITSGIMDNLPLLDNVADDGSMTAFNTNLAAQLTDCSTENLVRRSRENRIDSILGYAKYKYADFMYCKHAGKISNNHLITLRRYALPIGDDITFFNRAALEGESDNYQPDIARMVTWFGTEDNKLENILSYDYDASWREMKSDYEEQDSQENDQQRGFMGTIANMMSSDYMNMVKNGTVQLPFMKKFGADAAYSNNPVMLGKRYDKNRIYDPINTLRDTHKYEGVLTFRHEFTLKFAYKLKAYDNINPKSAMLDLLANILTMTYRNGNFWGGTRQIIGPTTNRNVWNKAEEIVGKTQNKIGDAFSQIIGGSFSFEGLGGQISDMLKQGIEGFKNFIANPGESLDNMKDSPIFGALKTMGNSLVTAGLSGLHNKLGRPSVYSFSSLLDGSDVGLWHVTIGNPLNPIASFGNLIMTKAKVTHSGPLSIDDFPTELTVEVTLKHARSRDSQEIQRMYTRGQRAIYYAFAVNEMADNSLDGKTGNYNNNVKINITDEKGNNTGETINRSSADPISTNYEYFTPSVDAVRTVSIRNELM